MIKRRVVFFEAEGGSDKWLDGHRRDTQPIVFALKARGWDAEIVFYRDEWKERIIEYCAGRFDAYISRESAMRRVVLGQMGIGLGIAKIIDRHDLEFVSPSGFVN